jgi:predicted DNA-binding transcriptional regulator AlpA
MTKTVSVAEHPDLVPSPETARLLGLTEKSLQRMAQEGRGPRRSRIGNRSYYWRPEIDAWLRQKFEQAAG